ncbi:family 20 glycosylhydrolase, partial [Brachybacterium sp. AOP25-B2-12]|uniref:family 20 glycosylhydrolase n=1 Tax=Brachybacterium sp. AOP25-B2-12 TaxID=3457710 RepID=UPI0040338303
MLDVGRKFFTEDYVNDTIEMMGWYKMNEFQIHLSDNEIKPRDLDGDGAPDWDT